MVDPAPMTRPSVSDGVALAMFRAADIVGGDYRFSVFGLGVVTVSTQVPISTTTGPGTTTTTSAPSSGSTRPGTTTTTPVGSTTGTATTTTAAGPGSHAVDGAPTDGRTAPRTAALPRYNGRLAWVGIAWGIRCPAGAVGPRAPTRYVAVVIDAETGRSVLAYTSRSAAACNGPVLPASVSRPDELVSVPWQPVGPASTAVHVTLPACGTYYGWTEVAAPSAEHGPGRGPGALRPGMLVERAGHRDGGRRRPAGEGSDAGPPRRAGTDRRTSNASQWLRLARGPPSSDSAAPCRKA